MTYLLGTLPRWFLCVERSIGSNCGFALLKFCVCAEPCIDDYPISTDVTSELLVRDSPPYSSKDPKREREASMHGMLYAVVG